mmetsp:Transcript_30512/g.27028  ORF Transcript_30512/g.27028 Transcript_30512/m.27028 type:complete len:100 (+) Transcript_30512:802-1101(+)
MPIPSILDLGNYRELLNLESNLLRQGQDGYSQRMINNMRQVKYIDLSPDKKKNISDDEVCSICHDIYSNTDNVKALDCDHIYHSKCISEWLKRNKKCPL